jgi:hypothetical protein
MTFLTSLTLAPGTASDTLPQESQVPLDALRSFTSLQKLDFRLTSSSERIDQKYFIRILEAVPSLIVGKNALMRIPDNAWFASLRSDIVGKPLRVQSLVFTSAIYEPADPYTRKQETLLHYVVGLDGWVFEWFMDVLAFPQFDLNALFYTVPPISSYSSKSSSPFERMLREKCDTAKTIIKRLLATGRTWRDLPKYILPLVAQQAPGELAWFLDLGIPPDTTDGTHTALMKILTIEGGNRRMSDHEAISSSAKNRFQPS